tara:strand:+ start:2019 stop:2255 length:237 start_codon:yes stop_codon:yes gene_type:complete
MLTETIINERIQTLDEDIQKVVQNISSVDKQRTDLVATLHALQGAKQQCNSFLQEIHSEPLEDIRNDEDPQEEITWSS